MPRRLSLPAILLAGLFPISAALGQLAPKSQNIVLSSPAFCVVLDASNGSLLRLIDPALEFDFIGNTTATNFLWRIDLLPGLATNGITPSMAGKFRWELAKKLVPELTMAWTEFKIPGAERLQVEVKITLEVTRPQSYWSIAIRKPSGFQVDKVRFPRIPEIRRQKEERLAVPVWMGQLTQTPRKLIAGPKNAARRLEWFYPGSLSLQCLAFYQQNGPGLYLACDDTGAEYKGFAFWGERHRRIGYEMLLYPENEGKGRTRFAPAYHAIIGAFRGDWITAAERYRQWGTNQSWAIASRLHRGLAPEWLLNTGLWVWNRGASESVLNPAAVLQAELKLPVSILWHWWHGCAYDAGFPEYLPPREGSEPFKTALSAAHHLGLHAMVYMNQRLWGMTTRSWSERGAEKYALKGADGKVKPEIYNTYTRQACASMCLATPFWRHTYASVAAAAARDLGVDGIYMDQACSNPRCYDPNHGHPVRGGTSWINGFRLLAAEVRGSAPQRSRLLLSGEGVGEAWLPYLDLMLALQVSRERYATPRDGWECIPFFHAVYHSCGVVFGNYASLTIPPYDDLWPPEFAPREPYQLLDRQFTTQFYLEQARTFSWGNQPMLANFFPNQLALRGEEMAYVFKLARVRALAGKFLLYGTFLRPPGLAASPVTIPISHLSIYAGRKGKTEEKPGSGAKPATAVKTSSEKPAKTISPPLIVGAWLARDQSVGIAAANLTSAVIPLTIEASQYGFAVGDSVRLISEDGRKEWGRIKDDGRIIYPVQPRDAIILELSAQ